jgi:lipopolysaccharide/colanic/teichoic acid biosynthesis glycosyltransferase
MEPRHSGAQSLQPSPIVLDPAPMGSFLRRTRIDALPQLWTVMRGEVSLLGPAPHPIALDQKYQALVPGLMQRYKVKPGLTGFAQVSGARRPIIAVAIKAGVSSTTSRTFKAEHWRWM